MDALFALAPLVATLALALAGRGFLVSCGAGVALAVIGAAFSPRFALAFADAPVVVAAAAALGLNVFAALGAGLYLASVLDKRRSVERACDWALQSGLPRGRLAVALILGMGPLAGSGAGFGAGFLLTIPILQRAMRDPRAVGRVGLLSANIVPWGALALPSLVGAEITGIPLASLASATSLTSALVFPFIACVAVLATPRAVRDEPLPRALGFALLIGAWTPFSLWVHSTWLAPQTAGALTALSSIALCLALSWRRLGPGRGGVVKAMGPLMTPYLMLAGVIYAFRVAPPVWERLEAVALFDAGGLAFRPFVNPALALALVALALGGRPRARAAGVALFRALRPAASVLAFALLAQIMRATGMVAWLAGQVGASWPAASHIVLTPLVGMFSALGTGSGLAANALMMEAQAKLGAASGAERLYAAAQNSASGHAILGSLAMVAILRAVARANPDLPQPEEQGALVRYGFAIALGNTAMVAVAFAIARAAVAL